MGDKHELYKLSDEKTARDCTNDLAVDPEMVNYVSNNFRVLPIFEKSHFEYKYIKSHRMQTNELLRRRWQRYRENYHNRKITALNFPSVHDLHFYNNTIRSTSEMIPSRCSSVRMNLKPGPGFDQLGDRPIPNELLMKRGQTNKKVSFSKKETKKESCALSEDKPVKQSVDTEEKKGKNTLITKAKL
ncbi:hypothetical protein NE865_15296 [Phthorimaea operculella]|nr:hypothetical protein NE865_15296 [Phthorimaea operculella]